MESTQEIWQDLMDLYHHQGGIFRIYDLQEEIYALSQEDKTIT